MNITIIAPGSRGDVQPYVALGKGLVNAGHRATVVTHEDFESLVTGHGVGYQPVPGKVQAIAQSDAMRRSLESGKFVKVLREMKSSSMQGSVSMARAALEASRGADIIVGGIGGLFTGVAVAEKLDLPFVQAYYIPMTPNATYPSFMLPGQPQRLPAFLNRASYHLVQRMMWQSFRPADKLARREVLDMPPLAAFASPFDAPLLRQTPILYGYSPTVIPPAPDWDDRTHVTGYWFLEAGDEWMPPDELQAFLDAGEPPVYIGFGSMGNSDPAAMTALILDAVQQTGQRAIMLKGWGGMAASAVPDNVLLIDGAPFTWLFPRCKAVVHHGGTGTTAEGFRAGVPAVVVPFFADQPFWGQRVYSLGCGPQPIPRRQLTADKLAAAIDVVAHDPDIRLRAQEIGVQVRKEDGLRNAIDILEAAFSPH